MTRSATAAVCAAALSVCALQSAQAADNFPNRAVRMIVPFPVGGATDILARVVAQKSSELFGHQVVVDNRPGAGGTLGSRIAVTATADGYTVLMGTTSTHAIGPHLYAKRQQATREACGPFDQGRFIVVSCQQIVQTQMWCVLHVNHKPAQSPIGYPSLRWSDAAR